MIETIETTSILFSIIKYKFTACNELKIIRSSITSVSNFCDPLELSAFTSPCGSSGLDLVDLIFVAIKTNKNPFMKSLQKSSKGSYWSVMFIKKRPQIILLCLRKKYLVMEVFKEKLFSSEINFLHYDRQSNST